MPSPEGCPFKKDEQATYLDTFDVAGMGNGGTFTLRAFDGSGEEISCVVSNVKIIESVVQQHRRMKKEKGEL